MSPDTVHDPEILDEASEGKEAQLVRSDETLPPQLTLLPLSNRPLFPGLVVPLIYEGEEMGKIVRDLAASHEQHVGLVLVRDEDEPYAPENLYEVGVVARVAKAVEIEGHGLHLVVECLRRFRIEGFLSNENPIRVLASYRSETSFEDNITLRAYTVAIVNTIKELLKHNPLYEEELRLFASRFDVNEPTRLADFAASLTTASRQDLQDILETDAIFER
ncbi:MAG: LON peptidase substrate-binding domain-containing protein, partial [Mariprofundus sp.]